MAPAVLDPEIVNEALDRARRQLLHERTGGGHWEGLLSSSALSTATACFALWMVHQRRPATAAQIPPVASGETPTSIDHPSRLPFHIQSGLRWLIDHQNADGGWGDTTGSPSNISTTVLCWAAMRAIDPQLAQPGSARAFGRTNEWLARQTGDRGEEGIIDAVIRRYGRDRTFSVPILTMGALAGVFGEGIWRKIPQLPFELAALPQSWFRFLGLPVVSYALPALIAMGLVRHHRRPTRNPAARLLRLIVRGRVLRVLRRIQPEGGGFLEATPLTSFVVMSLAGCGFASGCGDQDVVLRAGVEFLIRSARPDGSWPIDTNLATWLTTLSINALSIDGRLAERLPAQQRKGLARWLLAQQYRVRHAYTGAAPGAWAWTDLPGGVPDADDTAGALLALARLGEEAGEAAERGIEWLLDLQNSDGGIPTFCRGWGKLPFDRSAPELTAHALLAWDVWRDRIGPKLAQRLDRAIDRAVSSLVGQQRAQGAWAPLWFGNQSAPDQENPVHGTARVLLALARPRIRAHAAAGPIIARGIAFLLAAQNPDGGWGGAPGVASSIEETAQVLTALKSLLINDAAQPGGADAGRGDALRPPIDRGVEWLVRACDAGRAFPPSPLGLYFAKLWYSEKLYPVIGTVAALSEPGA